MSVTALRSLTAIPGVQTAHELFAPRPVTPVSPALAPLFAGGGLPQGESVNISGPHSFALALAAIAHTTQEHQWCASVGVGTPAVASLLDYGVSLDSYVNIAVDPAEWLRAVSILIDSFAVVIVKPGYRLTPTEQARLDAKVREKNMTLIVLDSPTAQLRIEDVHWDGLGAGRGRLEQCAVTVASPTGRHRLHLPDRNGHAS